VQPMAFAELRQRVWFSFLSHGLRSFFVLIAHSSIVPGTATLIQNKTREQALAHS
jgi:hypothetical protein